MPRDESCAGAMDAAGQLVLRYVTDPQPDGKSSADVPYPANPNGSVADIAAVCDATGRVCGLMPHPERHIEPTHHPRWTRRTEQPEHGEGFRVFQNAVAYFR